MTPICCCEPPLNCPLDQGGVDRGALCGQVTEQGVLCCTQRSTPTSGI
jgi:hypothetical protein